MSSAAYDLTKVNVGSWWAGMIVAVAGLFAMISKKRCDIITPLCITLILCCSLILSCFPSPPCLQHSCAATMGIALSVAALVLCFVGTIIDGLNSAVFRDFDVCLNTGTGVRYGNQENTNSTLPCMIDAFNEALAGNFTAGHADCKCASSGDEDMYDCIDITLRGDSGDCEKLLTIMPELLLASCLILLACLFLVLFYSCMSCRSVCCSDNAVVPDAPVPANASYYVVNAVEQPPAVLLSPTEVQSTHVVDIENHEQGHVASGGDNGGTSGGSGGAQGGVYAATITAYPIKGVY